MQMDPHLESWKGVCTAVSNVVLGSLALCGLVSPGAKALKQSCGSALLLVGRWRELGKSVIEVVV